MNVVGAITGAETSMLRAVMAGEKTQQRASTALWGFSWGQQLCALAFCEM
jgi:hypothetical protein